MGESDIEKSGQQSDLPLLTLSERELALLRLALDSGASENEIAKAGASFVQSLRARGITGQDFEPLLEQVPEVEEPVIEELVVEPELTHFEKLTAYVLAVPLGPSPKHQLVPEFAHLHEQFRRQAVFTGRIGDAQDLPAGRRLFGTCYRAILAWRVSLKRVGTFGFYRRKENHCIVVAS